MRQLTALAVFALLVAVSGPGAGVALAQVGYTPSSIEWLTASSDVVVRASVAELAFKDRAPNVGETESQWQWVTVTLKVRSTFASSSAGGRCFCLYTGWWVPGSGAVAITRIWITHSNHRRDERTE